MIKPIDIICLLKIIANPQITYDINQLSTQLFVNRNTIGNSIKQLITVKLITDKKKPILKNCEEFVIAIKYMFPETPMSITCGIPASYASSFMSKYIVPNSDPIPLWPYAEGTHRGLMFKPLIKALAKSVTVFPDQVFHDLISLIDTLRDTSSRCREKHLAEDFLKKTLKNLIKG